MGTYQKDNQIPGCASKSQEISYSTIVYLRKRNKMGCKSQGLSESIIYKADMKESTI